MKKLLLLSLCMLTVLTGCSSTTSNESGEETGTPSEFLPEESSPIAEDDDAAEELLHVTIEDVKISVDQYTQAAI